jgi:hypothetical protein
MRSVTLRTDDQNETESVATQLPKVDMAAAIRDAGFPAEGLRVTAVYYPFGDLFKPSRDETPAAGGEDEAGSGDESED